MNNKVSKQDQIDRAWDLREAAIQRQKESDWKHAERSMKRKNK
jgi:hypothetical protein